jgi:hypothetical protein
MLRLRAIDANQTCETNTKHGEPSLGRRWRDTLLNASVADRQITVEQGTLKADGIRCGTTVLDDYRFAVCDAVGSLASHHPEAPSAQGATRVSA